MLSNQKLHSLHQDGLITLRFHPTKVHLGICKYTRGYSLYPYKKPQEWDPDIMRCRGLIWDFFSDKIVAQPFIKFFNSEEYPEVYIKHLFDTYPFLLKEKYDGSLISSFSYGGEHMCTSSGAWDSWQAQKAAQIFAQGEFNEKPGLTYCYELIAPENRIVVNYGNDERLQFLGALDQKGRMIFDCDSLDPNYLPTYESIREEQQQIKEDKKQIKEGFVIFFPDINFRLKVKYKEYITLHKIRSHLTAKNITMNYLFGDKDLLNDFVDDNVEFVINVIDETKFLYEQYTENIKTRHKHCLTLPTRKEQALYIKEIPMKPFERSCLFSALDNKDYDSFLRKSIVEEMNQKYPAFKYNDVNKEEQAEK